MGISWSAMRNVLEKENICDSLKGRVQYFATRYRKAHDQTGRVAVRFDGEEVFKSHWEYWFGVYEETKNHGGFDRHGFYEAFYEYHNQSIDKSLISSDPVVRLFAILDKRVGKRRLQSMRAEIAAQPMWLQVFYKLRLDAELHKRALKNPIFQLSFLISHFSFVCSEIDPCPVL